MRRAQQYGKTMKGLIAVILCGVILLTVTSLLISSHQKGSMATAYVTSPTNQPPPSGMRVETANRITSAIIEQPDTDESETKSDS